MRTNLTDSLANKGDYSWPMVYGLLWFYEKWVAAYLGVEETPVWSHIDDMAAAYAASTIRANHVIGSIRHMGLFNNRKSGKIRGRKGRETPDAGWHMRHASEHPSS
jgi:hypothetical protein